MPEAKLEVPTEVTKNVEPAQTDDPIEFASSILLTGDFVSAWKNQGVPGEYEVNI